MDETPTTPSQAFVWIQDLAYQESGPDVTPKVMSDRLGQIYELAGYWADRTTRETPKE
jgi:hypothetical protein